MITNSEGAVSLCQEPWGVPCKHFIQKWKRRKMSWGEENCKPLPILEYHCPFFFTGISSCPQGPAEEAPPFSIFPGSQRPLWNHPTLCAFYSLSQQMFVPLFQNFCFFNKNILLLPAGLHFSFSCRRFSNEHIE